MLCGRQELQYPRATLNVQIPICHLTSCVMLFKVSRFSVREGNGTPLQYSCLENPMDGGAWQAAVHGVTRSRTRLSDFTFTFTLWRRKWQPTPVFLPGESQGWWSLVGCCLWGRTELDMTEVTQQQQQQQAEMISSHTAFILTGRSSDAIPKQKTLQILSTHKL